MNVIHAIEGDSGVGKINSLTPLYDVLGPALPQLHQLGNSIGNSAAVLFGSLAWHLDVSSQIPANTEQLSLSSLGAELNNFLARIINGPQQNIGADSFVAEAFYELCHGLIKNGYTPEESAPLDLHSFLNRSLANDIEIDWFSALRELFTCRLKAIGAGFALVEPDPARQGSIRTREADSFFIFGASVPPPQALGIAGSNARPRLPQSDEAQPLPFISRRDQRQPRSKPSLKRFLRRLFLNRLVPFRTF